MDAPMAERGWTTFAWFARHRHFIAACATGAAGLLLLLAGTVRVASADTIDRQLAALIGPGLMGLALLSVAAFAYWAGQRQRERGRLADIHVFVAAVADAARSRLAQRDGTPVRGPVGPAGAKRR